MKKKSIIILLIIIAIINALMPITVQAKENTADEKNNSFFDDSITFSSEYIPGSGNIMPHGVITPSTANSSEAIPLIVWLHGSGEFKVGEVHCLGGESNPNLLPWVLMNDNSLKKFNAYVLIPHSTSGNWVNENALKNVSNLIDAFVKEKKNVDTNNIVIAGHSMGSQGALYMAINMDKMSYKFSKLVITSGYNVQGLEKVNIPTIGYFEAGLPSDFMSDIPTAEPVIPLNCGHGEVPKTAYLKDDGNKCSDLIEWMFGDYKVNSGGTTSPSTTTSKNYSDDTDDGGLLLDAMAELLCFVPDTIFDVLQKMLVSEQGIDVGNIANTSYKILYSPAKIFSGGVPAFDINFITAESYENTYYGYVRGVLEDSAVDAAGNYDGTKFEEAKKKTNVSRVYYKTVREADPNANAAALQQRQEGHHEALYWVEGENLRIECRHYTITGSTASVGTYYSTSIPLANASSDEINYPSTASILQNIIATWYNTLRRIALVGLLSALVYIGIRIVLSSASAKDKAKYKKMLKDWLVALCILFTIHYIMSITVTVVNSINEVIQASTIGASGEDVLLTRLRNEILQGDDWGAVLVDVVIYCVLAVYTVIFTIQYFRRTIYIAFLTMIAPLITLTYPLDKIKDSKSQAFDIWIKDYIFFVLLQVVHLLIYYILVGSSLDLANSGNWMFALVAIGFLVPAEKVVKKMFGFEKSSSMGALAAGATGALVMNAVNKVGGLVGKGAKGGSEKSGGDTSSNKIRTAGSNPLAALQGNGATGGAAGILGSGSGGNGAAGGIPGSNSSENGVAGGTSPKKQVPKEIKGAWSIGKKFLKSGASGALSIGGAAAGAMLGFAGGVAQGDLGAAITGGFAGGAAGKGIAKGTTNFVSNISGNVRKSIDNVKNTWNEGAYGADFAQNASAAREFKRSSDYKSLKEKYGENLTDENLRDMMAADITDAKTMGKILESGNVGKGIAYYTMAKDCPENIYYNPDLLRTYVTDIVRKERGEIEGAELSQKDADEIIKNMKKYR